MRGWWLALLCMCAHAAHADYPGGRSSVGACSTLSLAHGRVRTRKNSRIAKFVCFPGWELVGSRYATCQARRWDVPPPTCVKAGCEIPRVDNGLVVPSVNNAWLSFFCLPGFALRGQRALYCDGRTWNASAPTCYSNDTREPALTCDFELPDICGWQQDVAHDFDWTRQNQHTPSAMLRTGPHYDHTLGEGKQGYYMYIETSSRLENDSARLLSPVYNAAVSREACFSFYYHMFGNTIGGLRVYQKPVSVSLSQLLTSERDQYLMWQLWGNQGDRWLHAAPALAPLTEDFQIVVEGVRGRSFTSDIAVDDVAVLHGEDCAPGGHTTPLPEQSCKGRCIDYDFSRAVAAAGVGSGAAVVRGVWRDEAGGDGGCGCSVQCILDDNCCPDFYEQCLFTNKDEDTTTPPPPRTERLVAPSAAPASPAHAPSTSTTTTITTTTTTSTFPTTTTPKLVSTTTTKTLSTRIMTKSPKTASIKPTVATTTTARTRTTPKLTAPTTKRSVPTAATAITAKTTTVNVSRSTTSAVVRPFTGIHRVPEGKKSATGGGSGWRWAVAVLAVLAAGGGAAWCAGRWRGGAGREALARLRGRARRDPEVRYLSAHEDE